MPVIPAEQVHAGPHPTQEELVQTLLAGQPLRDDTGDHVMPGGGGRWGGG